MLDATLLDLDLQAGPLRGDSAGKNRVMLPDFELGLGLLPNAQLELDGTFSLDEFDGASRHYTSDPLWVAMKFSVFAKACESFVASSLCDSAHARCT